MQLDNRMQSVEAGSTAGTGKVPSPEEQSSTYLQGRLPMTPARRPPGPKGHILKGNMPEFWHDPLGFVTMCARRYGDVVILRMGPRTTYQLNHPDDIENVLVTNNRKFIKHPAMSLNRYLFGNGLLVSEGDYWLRQRRLVQPAFHRKRIAEYGETMVSIADRLTDHWQDGQTRDVHADMMRVTVEIVARTLFGANMESEVDAIEDAQREVMNAYYSRFNSYFFLLSEKIPTPTNRKMKRAAQQLDESLFRAILRRRADSQDRGDLLSTLLAMQNTDDGSQMTDVQLRDEVMNLFLAGHETSANTLSWAWYLLAQHPAVEARLHDELRDELGGNLPTAADLPRLRYTEMVVKEVMRLYPPLWIMGRQAIEDSTIGGYPVRAGTLLQMSQWVVHHDPRFYDEPDTFKPDRWADNLAKRLPKYAYFPFGGGARMCIGNTFAMMEVALVIATIAQRFHLALAPGQAVRPLPSMTLRPASGIPMVVWRRS